MNRKDIWKVNNLLYLGNDGIELYYHCYNCGKVFQKNDEIIGFVSNIPKINDIDDDVLVNIDECNFLCKDCFLGGSNE